MTDMELKDILAISGQPGLFRYVARSSNGVIVESLADGRRMNSSGTAKISALAEIAIYTETEELPLWQVFEKFYAYTDGKPTIDAKSDAVLLKKTFGEVVPDYDRDRVHVSDMKKVVSWFNLLVGADRFPPRKGGRYGDRRRERRSCCRIGQAGWKGLGKSLSVTDLQCAGRSLRILFMGRSGQDARDMRLRDVCDRFFGTSFFASCTVFFMPCSVGCAGREQGRSFLFRMRAVS